MECLSVTIVMSAPVSIQITYMWVQNKIMLMIAVEGIEIDRTMVKAMVTQNSQETT